LRGSAAILVVLFHTGGLVGPLAVLKPIGAMGWSGVGLFLVLSGFSIHFRWAASDVPHHDFAIGRFARRRFFRLYPTYLAAVAASIVVAAALGAGFDLSTPLVFTNGDTPIAIGLATQVLLVGANFIHVPYVAVTWSLGLEAQLYAMYAVLVGRLRSIGVLRVVGWAFFVTLVWRVGSQVVTTSMPVGQFFPDGHADELSRLLFAQLPARCFEWLLGVLAAEMYFGRVRRPTWTCSPWVAIALLIVAAILFRHPVGTQTLNEHDYMASDIVLDQLLGLAFFVVLLAAIHREDWSAHNAIGSPIMKALGAVGVVSYSLYLLHPAALQLSSSVLQEAGLNGAGATVVQWAFTLVTAWLLYLAVEHHFADGRVDRWTAAKLAARRERLATDPT
jgi:peptidoglycan/LPS O-acetylase OafA/YrhL